MIKDTSKQGYLNLTMSHNEPFYMTIPDGRVIEVAVKKYGLKQVRFAIKAPKDIIINRKKK